MSGLKTLDLDVLARRPQSTAPSSPTVGQEYLRSSDNHVLRYDGSAWIDTDAGGGGGGGATPSTYNATFANGLATVPHPGALTSQRVVVSRDGESDDAEMDPLALSAWVSSTDTITVRATTLAGRNFEGTARVNYLIG